MMKDLTRPLVDLGIEAMSAAMERIESLGESAKDKIPATETALGKADDLHVRGDVESEEAMVEVLGIFGEENGVLFNFHGEEVGVLAIGDDDPWAVLTAVADGIDGTTVFGQDKAAGPMLALAVKGNPTYKDFFVGLVGSTLTGEFIVAANGLLQLHNQYGPINLKPFGSVEFDPRNMVCDTYTRVAEERFKHEEIAPHGGSTAAVAFYMCLSGSGHPHKGSQIHGLLDATRKLNLEQPTMYALMRFFGGVYETVDGYDPGGEEFLEWHRNPDPESPNQVPLIIAVSRKAVNYAKANLLR